MGYPSEDLAAKLSAEKRGKTPASVGGAKKEYKSTDTKITFIKNNKEYTRVVYTNKRNTEYVKYENHWIPVSKLHKKGGSPPTKKLKTVTSETGVDERKKVTWKPGVGERSGIDLNKSPPHSAYSRQGNNKSDTRLTLSPPKGPPKSSAELAAEQRAHADAVSTLAQLRSGSSLPPELMQLGHLSKKEQWDALLERRREKLERRRELREALKPFRPIFDPSDPYTDHHPIRRRKGGTPKTPLDNERITPFVYNTKTDEIEENHEIPLPAAQALIKMRNGAPYYVENAVAASVLASLNIKK
uniref:Uncharacterized protein n=1 Tax=viral metagenome TaxID=1070528 RepID=A0A6C0KXV7_9ZZZZ